MTSTALRRVVFALLVLVVTSACNGKGPLGPDPLPPPTGGGCPPGQFGTPPNCAPGSPLPDLGTVTSVVFRWAVTEATVQGNVVSGLSRASQLYIRADLPRSAAGKVFRILVNGKQVHQATAGANGSILMWSRAMENLLYEMGEEANIVILELVQGTEVVEDVTIQVVR